MLDHPASILRIAWLYGGNSTHTIGIGFRIQNRAVFSPYSSELPFISVVKSSSFALSLTFGRFHPQPSFFPYTLSLQSVAVIQSPSHASLFVTLWILVRQASLSFTISRSLPRLMSIELGPTISPSDTPFSSCLQSFPAQSLFQWVGSSHHVAKVLELQLQHQSF